MPSGPPGPRPGPAAQAILTGCRLWGNMAPAAAGLPRSAALAAGLPALPRLHTRCAKGTGAATPADGLPSAAAGSSGARRGSVPPPRGHSPAAASFVAVESRRAEGGRERRTSRAWDGHQRSALFRRRSDRRAAPATPGRGGTGPDGARGGGNSRPSAGANNPLHGLAVVDAIVRPETPGGGDSSLLFCPLSKGENPAGGRGSQCPRRERRKPRRRRKSPGRHALLPVVGAGAKPPARHRAMNKGGRQEEEEGGGRGLSHRRRGSEQLQ